MKAPITADPQPVTFAELFFDLAFVFAVTQTVDLFEGEYSLETILRATLAFWLIWGAWTQLTWTLNVADTSSRLVVLGTLFATAMAFFMAIALPSAFGGGVWLFVLAYLVIRAIGLGLDLWMSSATPGKMSTASRYALLSLPGIAAVLVGAALGGTAQYVCWSLAVALELIPICVAGRSDNWSLHIPHFCERHGLFVIVALGETLIVAASGKSHLSAGVFVLVSALVVAIAGGMWWLYFHRLKGLMEEGLLRAKGNGQTAMARDAYSLIHFLILCGIISFAIGIEHAMVHEADHGSREIRLAGSFAVLLFGGGTVLAFWRTTGRILWVRLMLSLGTFVPIALIVEMAPLVALLLALGLIAVLVAVESKTLARMSSTT